MNIMIFLSIGLIILLLGTTAVAALDLQFVTAISQSPPIAYPAKIVHFSSKTRFKSAKTIDGFQKGLDSTSCQMVDLDKSNLSGL